MAKKFWISATGQFETFGQVVWEGNVPAKSKVLGYYLLAYTNNIVAPDTSNRYRKFVTAFNDAFGAVWYSKIKISVGSPSANANKLLYYWGDLFVQPIEVSEGMTSIAFTSTLDDQIEGFGFSGSTVDGSDIILGCSLLVEF